MGGTVTKTETTA